MRAVWIGADGIKISSRSRSARAALASRQGHQLNQHWVPVVSLAGLLEMKRIAGRPKDLLDIAELTTQLR